MLRPLKLQDARYVATCKQNYELWTVPVVVLFVQVLSLTKFIIIPDIMALYKVLYAHSTQTKSLSKLSSTCILLFNSSLVLVN